MAKAKDLVQWVSTQEINDALLTKTSKLIARVRTSEEGQEGLSAFLEKRSAS